MNRIALVCALALSLPARPVRSETALPAAPSAAKTVTLPVGPVPVFEEYRWPVFAEADFLQWWVPRGRVTVPLVASPTAPLDLSGPGAALSNPAVRVVSGNAPLGPASLPGARLRFGLAPTDSGDPGVELGALLLPRVSESGLFTLDTNPNGLLVPFLVPALGESGLAVAGSIGGALVPGSAAVSYATEAWGADVAASARLYCDDRLRVDLRAGFRHFFLSDTLTLRTTSLNGAESFSTFDRFLTRNYFFGPQGGARASWASDRIEARARFDLALGVTAESLRVSGQTTRPASAIAARPGPATVNGGLLSVPALGVNREARFTALQEWGLEVGYRLSDAVSVRLGYTILHLSSARRAGEQINRTVSPAALPLNGGDFSALPTPAPVFRHGDLTLHGLNFGLEVAF